MKLIDEKELVGQLLRHGFVLTEHAWDNIWKKCEVDPADLDKMNLAALGVLDKIKEFCEEKDKSRNDEMLVEENSYHLAFGIILDRIKDLESAADPKESFAKAQDKPDYEAMIEDLEIDFDGVYAFQLAARSARLKDILKKVRAEHTPKSEKPEVKDDSNK